MIKHTKADAVAAEAVGHYLLHGGRDSKQRAKMNTSTGALLEPYMAHWTWTQLSFGAMRKAQTASFKRAQTALRDRDDGGLLPNVAGDAAVLLRCGRYANPVPAALNRLLGRVGVAPFQWANAIWDLGAGQLTLPGAEDLEVPAEEPLPWVAYRGALDVAQSRCTRWLPQCGGCPFKSMCDRGR